MVLVDLDGTLVDRPAAFSAWAGSFVREVGGSDADRRWLLDLDGDGYTPRLDVARALRERFGLAEGVPRLVDRLLFEHVEAVEPYPGVVAEEPDRAIFATALEGAVRCGGTGAAWILGDHPVADVAGGRASGVSTGWVSHGRSWPGGLAPDLSAVTTAELLSQLLAAARAG